MSALTLLLLLGKFAIVVCCAEVLFQPSFLHVVWMLHAGWSHGTYRNLTLHRLSAHSRDLLTPHLWTAVCIGQAKECLRVIHVLPMFHPVLSLPMLHAQLFVVLGFTLRAQTLKTRHLLVCWCMNNRSGRPVGPLLKRYHACHSLLQARWSSPFHRSPRNRHSCAMWSMAPLDVFGWCGARTTVRQHIRRSKLMSSSFDFMVI